MNISPEKKDQLRREREINDINVVLNIPEGRRLFWRILDKSGVFRSPFVDSGGRREFTDFYCGMKDLGLWLFSEIEHAKPDALQIIKREYNSREKMDQEDQKDEIENKSVLDRP
jgi:hypothetical protein